MIYQPLCPDGPLLPAGPPPPPPPYSEPSYPLLMQALREVRALITDAGLSESESTLLIRRLGCLGVQLQRHSYQAYNPVVEKIQALYDIILHGTLQPLESVPIHLPPRAPGTYKSGLMRLSEEYDDVLDEVGRELHW